MLGDYREQVDLLVRQHRGRLVDFTGDNFLAEFPTALDAVQSAVEIQRVLAGRNAELPAERKMEFRIGLHMGDIRVEGERIFGDGVNIAARLESLAAPGGICISATVHEQVRNKLQVGYDDLGDQTVKNIPDQVHVYRVRLEADHSSAEARPALVRGVLLVATLLVFGLVGAWLWGGSGDWSVGGGPTSTAPGPSLAVLPFTNMSGDPEQEYFADGITEDLITDLSKLSGLVVIARNSVFTYKGRAVRVEQIGRELGVRYVLEGSVRKAGDRVRVTAQLVETSNGHHVWAERYDRRLEDIFTVQDEITGEIVAALELSLSEGERGRIGVVPTGNMEAYDLFLRGEYEVLRGDREAQLRGQALLKQAIELDPEFGAAYALLSESYMGSWLGQYVDDPSVMTRALELAEEGARRDAQDPYVLRQLAAIYVFIGREEEAIAVAEKALELNPNEANAYRALTQAYLFLGRMDEAELTVAKAKRLDPHNWMSFYLEGVIQAWAGRFREAIPPLRRASSIRPAFVPPHMILAWAYAETGDLETARTEVAEVLRISPRYSLAELENRIKIRSPATFERLKSTLRPLGLE
jgi:adenylate cyclase